MANVVCVILDPTWGHDIVQKVFIIRDGGDVDDVVLQGWGGDGLQGFIDDVRRGVQADGPVGLGPAACHHLASLGSRVAED